MDKHLQLSEDAFYEIVLVLGDKKIVRIFEPYEYFFRHQKIPETQNGSPTKFFITMGQKTFGKYFFDISFFLFFCYSNFGSRQTGNADLDLVAAFYWVF